MPTVNVAPNIPTGAVQFQGGFIYNPVLLTPWNMVGDWGLKVNQPTYAFNSFFVNSISGAPGIGQTIEFRCAIPPGRYTFRVWAPRGPDCGIINVLMNGVSLLVGTDLYDPALTPGSVISVPVVATAEGLQSIVFTVTGKNALSSNFYLRMHQFQLVPYLDGVI